MVQSLSVLQYVLYLILILSNVSQVEISDILMVQNEITQTVTSVRTELHTYT